MSYPHLVIARLYEVPSNPSIGETGTKIPSMRCSKRRKLAPSPVAALN